MNWVVVIILQYVQYNIPNPLYYDFTILDSWLLLFFAMTGNVLNCDC